MHATSNSWSRHGSARWPLVALTLVLLWIIARHADAQSATPIVAARPTPHTAFPPVHSTVAAPAAPAAQSVAKPSLSAALRQLLLESLPEEFEDHDDWGQTKRVTSGLKFKTHGGKLLVEKRTKEVRHGLWKKYRATLVDPKNQLELRIGEIHRESAGRIAFQVVVSARLQGEARVERWRQGVKMLNFMSEAETTIEARLDCELAAHLVSGKYLAGVALEPKVKAVSLRLADFDLKRVSKLEGAAAHELGNSLRDTIQKELRDQEPKLATKLNDVLAKRQSSLRLSPEEWVVAGWSKAQGFLGYARNLSPTAKTK